MKKLTYIFFAAIIIVAYSCTEKMEIELDDTYTRLVVEGRFSTDTTIHTVRLTKSSSYFYNQAPPPVSNALITISDGNTTITLNENATKPGIYETPVNTFGKIGSTYKLLIKNVDINNDGIMEEYDATSTIYPINQIDSISTKYYTDFEAWEIKCFVQDPPTEDYYLFHIYKNNVLMTDTLTEPLVVDDKLYNGNYTNGIGVGYLRDEKSGERGYLGDSIRLETWRIDKNFFKFVSEYKDALRTQTPLFSGPPANVKGNVSNGAIGYFAAYSVSKASTTIKETIKK